MRSVSQAIEMLDITDNKREVFNGLNKHRDYSLSKTLKKLPTYLANGYELFRLYLLKPLDSKDFQPSIR